MVMTSMRVEGAVAAETGHGDVNAAAGIERAGEPIAPFMSALRGYDRRQVDEAFTTVLAQLSAERQRVVALQGELSAAASSAARLPADVDDEAAQGGPGHRMERMLRAAQR